MSYQIRVLLALGLGFAALCTHAAEVNTPRPPDVKVARFLANSQIELVAGGNKATLQLGKHLGSWTFVGLVPGKAADSPRYAVVEDFEHQDGHMLFVDTRAVQIDLPKSLEPTFAGPGSLYLGHTQDEIMNSASDLLGNQILSEPGDPDYQEIARVFSPIRKIKLPYSFVGTPDVIDKVGFLYGGRTPDFDPAVYYPPINQIRDQGQVWDGLVGAYLPVLRFVYPESPGNWTEMIAFAPLRISNGNNRIQPVWYRVCRIENGTLKWTRYIDSYHPFPPRLDYDPEIFYTDLANLNNGWHRILQQSMTIDLPDERVANMARFSLVRAIMTRVGDFPKYGAFDKDYAGSEHDGFPDTFTVETAAMLNWGLVDRAGRYIDNYFGEFVRDDGSILYRGPETGQYGRMLTVVAQYANLGGDPAVLLKRRSRIDGVTKLLLGLRGKALTLPASDPAYGMIAGWSEADACLDPAPSRYMQPYFSNSTEAARGFRDLGMVWEALGRKNGDPELTAWGQRLVQEAAALQRDIETAISRSLLTVDGETVLPCIAGVKDPFHVAVPRDPTDPQYRSYRAYMEMMYSGSLSKEQVRMIFAYCSTHHDVILGVPTAYGYKTGELAGFLSYGYGYGLIQMDMIREALLLMYSDMAHQYTRGTWTAPETRNVLIDKPAEPYCTPSQLVVALLTRWLLVFEDPESNTLWLCKALPRTWLEDGKTTAVSGAATKWGRLGFSVVSHIKSGTIAVQIDFPTSGFKAPTNFRLRAPGEMKLKSVTLNGKGWTQFDTEAETIYIPAGRAGTVTLVAQY